MDDFGMLAKDFGFRPQGKSAPMKSSGGDRRSRHSPSSATLSADGNGIFNDVFGGPPKYTNNNANSKSTSSMSDFDYDSIFKDSVSANNNEAKTKPTSSNSPVYDKPVYDDDVFDGLPGIKSKPISSSSSSGRYDDNIFASMTSSPPKPSPLTDHFDDLFSNLGRTEKAQPSKHQYDQSPRGFDKLIPGFGSGSPASGTRWNSDPSPKSANKTKEKSNPLDDPFSVLESISTPVTSSRTLFTDPLEEITKIGKSNTRKPSSSTDMFNDIDSLNNFNKSSPPSTKDPNNRGKTQTHSEEGSSIGSARSSVSRDPIDESNQSIFDMPTVSRTSPTSSQAGPSPKSEEKSDIWLTVSEIPLFTSVTRAPPPSRPPPPIPTQVDREEEMIIIRMREIERQAVERATKEARERAANEARVKSERAAVQRAQAEARERAAVEAKRAAVEKAALEAKESKEAREKAAVAKAQAEARRRAERAAVEKVTAEARQRAAAEARDRAAAKAKQQTNDNDLDSFFNSRPNSVPKSRTASDSAASDTLSRAPEAATHRPCSSGGASSNVRKASPTPNFVDDLTSVFGGTTTTMAAGEFQDFEGETDDRRRARLEREQRAQERAAKALAEKNERDMQSQKEQEERHRISTTLDVEIKRWAAGKEGNLRAMLSTLQYVLWPECGWQAISLTDLITGASVKKAYRKATLCIHPDKVQQKGANLQQKYVAEKVFDLLKEAWNKFNSEELF